MDAKDFPHDQMAPILASLERINTRLGGYRATLYHLDRFSARWASGQTIRFVDWGTGGADMPRAIVRWARRRGQRVEVIGVDHHPAVLAYARKACADYPEIQIQDRDLTQIRAGDWDADYALSSLCLHHLPDDAIIRLLQDSDRIVARGLIFNDLKRSARAWAWIWALSRVFRAPPVVQHDGPLSVRRAFTREELLRYAASAGLPYLRVSTHFGYRFTLSGEKHAA